MQPEPSPTSAEGVLPPKKSFLSDDALDEIWNVRGLKYRVDEFHQMLLNRGLANYVDRPAFRGMIREILQAFLVDGEARRDPKWTPRQRFPKVL